MTRPVGYKEVRSVPLIHMGPYVIIQYNTDMAIKRTSHVVYDTTYNARTVGKRMTCSVIEKYIRHHRDITQGPAQLEFKLR
jgi:hypothetical protein